MINYLNFLRQIAPLSDEAWQFFSQKFKEKKVSKGEIILQEGAIQKQLLLVLEGVQMSYYYHQDKQHIMAFTYPPSPSGVPDSFLSQTPSKFCLEAMTDSRFYAFQYEDLHQIFEEYPEVERLFRKMTESVLIGMIDRIRELQAFSMEERFRAFAKRSPHLFQLIPHKYLASYLNISPTNFSKLYNRIKI